MNHRQLLAAACVSLAATGHALAADLPIVQPQIYAPPPVLYNWQGFYIGMQGGYAGDWGEGDDDSNWSNGFVGGGHVGYNWQFGGWVVGVEGDVEWSGVGTDDDDDDLFDNAFDAFGYNVERDYTLLASARLRAGYAVDRYLFYATGGYAYASTDVEVHQQRRFSGFDNFSRTDSFSEGLNGWAIGTGVDVFVLPNLTVGVEYRYTDYEDTHYYIRRFANGPELRGGELANNFHAIRGRVAYKF